MITVAIFFHDKQPELFLSEVNNKETIAANEANYDMYCLQKRIEKFPLIKNKKFINPVRRIIKLES